ncbi:MAG: histidine phosphatase family protein [Neisseria sp.]|nr:histidine phosphatase family protein [Neisseria sp.]
MALEIYLVRHGKTVFNTVGRVQGWSDSPLTAEGREAAARLGRGLASRGIAFDAAFSSTSPRAAETAALILKNAGQNRLAAQQLPDLREYCFGGFEGELSRNLHEMLAASLGFPDTESWKAAYLNAESHVLAEAVSALDEMGLAEDEAALLGRLKNGMEQVAAQSAGLQRVLVVSHGMAITAFLKSIDFSAIAYRSVDNLAVSRLAFSDGLWRIDSVGETDFLAD